MSKDWLRKYLSLCTVRRWNSHLEASEQSKWRSTLDNRWRWSWMARRRVRRTVAIRAAASARPSRIDTVAGPMLLNMGLSPMGHYWSNQTILRFTMVARGPGCRTTKVPSWEHSGTGENNWSKWCRGVWQKTWVSKIKGKWRHTIVYYMNRPVEKYIHTNIIISKVLAYIIQDMCKHNSINKNLGGTSVVLQLLFTYLPHYYIWN